MFDSNFNSELFPELEAKFDAKPKPLQTVKDGVPLSEFSSEILAGFKTFGSAVQGDEESPKLKDTLLGQSVSIEEGRLPGMVPSLRINGVIANDAMFNEMPQSAKHMAHHEGRKAHTKHQEKLRSTTTEPSFLFPTMSSTDVENLDAISSGSNSPYMYPCDVSTSPATAYLTIDSDADELLSMHSDLSDVSKEYHYVSNLEELQQLTDGFDFDLPSQLADSDFQKFQSLQEPVQLEGIKQGTLLNDTYSKAKAPNFTPPKIHIEEFESQSESSKALPRLGTGTGGTSFDTNQSELSTPSSSSFGFNATQDTSLEMSNGRTGTRLGMHDPFFLDGGASPHQDLLSVSSLPTDIVLENDSISDTFDKMLQGRKNNNRKKSLSTNTRSRSRSRTPTVKSKSSRSLSPDERARSLSNDREHLLRLGGKLPKSEEPAEDSGETTLNKIGTTKKKQAQKHPAVYECPICGKKFTRPYNLKSHLRSHTNEKPYICSVCGKGFSRMHDKNRHEDLHSGKKRYVCGGLLKNGQPWGCGKKFARSDALGRHFKTALGKRCIKPLFEEAEREKRTKEEAQKSALLNKVSD